MYLRSLTIVIFSLFKLAYAGANDDNNGHDAHGRIYKHIAFFSIDGMHSSDVSKWVTTKPHGTIAKLVETGYWYKGALTSAPSDSFPGIVNLVSGAAPAMSGIWYDDAYGKLQKPL